MSHDACIKICRACDTDALLGPVRGTGDMYDLGGLTFLHRESVPLVIDHDHEKQIGEVFEPIQWHLTDGRWIVARARLDTSPDWIKQGTAASFSSRPLHSYEINGWRVVSRALVDDVTVVSATHRAVEACASVVLLQRHAPAAVSSRASAGASAGTVFAGDGRILRRPNFGQVLGVRSWRASPAWVPR